MPKRVPFPPKSSQYSALKSVPKKFKKKVQKIVLEKVPKKVQTLLKVPKIVPKKVLFLKKVPKKALFKALLAGRNLYAFVSSVILGVKLLTKDFLVGLYLISPLYNPNPRIRLSVCVTKRPHVMVLVYLIELWCYSFGPMSCHLCVCHTA